MCRVGRGALQKEPWAWLWKGISTWLLGLWGDIGGLPETPQEVAVAQCKMCVCTCIYMHIST